MSRVKLNTFQTSLIASVFFLLTLYVAPGAQAAQDNPVCAGVWLYSVHKECAVESHGPIYAQKQSSLCGETGATKIEGTWADSSCGYEYYSCSHPDNGEESTRKERQRNVGLQHHECEEHWLSWAWSYSKYSRNGSNYRPDDVDGGFETHTRSGPFNSNVQYLCNFDWSIKQYRVARHESCGHSNFAYKTCDKRVPIYKSCRHEAFGREAWVTKRSAECEIENWFIGRSGLRSEGVPTKDFFDGIGNVQCTTSDELPTENLPQIGSKFVRLAKTLDWLILDNVRLRHFNAFEPSSKDSQQLIPAIKAALLAHLTRFAQDLTSEKIVKHFLDQGQYSALRWYLKDNTNAANAAAARYFSNIETMPASAYLAIYKSGPEKSFYLPSDQRASFLQRALTPGSLANRFRLADLLLRSELIDITKLNASLIGLVEMRVNLNLNGITSANDASSVISQFLNTPSGQAFKKELEGYADRIKAGGDAAKTLMLQFVSSAISELESVVRARKLSARNIVKTLIEKAPSDRSLKLLNAHFAIQDFDQNGLQLSIDSSLEDISRSANGLEILAAIDDLSTSVKTLNNTTLEVVRQLENLPSENMMDTAKVFNVISRNNTVSVSEAMMKMITECASIAEQGVGSVSRMISAVRRSQDDTIKPFVAGAKDIIKVVNEKEDVKKLRIQLF